jgi:hypothetical protein
MRHQDLTLNHRLESWVYANAAARTGATGFVAGDVGRISYQTDTGEYWRLTATTPTWAALQNVPIGGTTGQLLKKNSATNYDASWATGAGGARLQTAQLNPASTTSTAGVMMGLGSTAHLTPTTTGSFLVTFCGGCRNGAAGQSAVLFGMRYGTGTAPTNGAAATGTIFGPSSNLYSAANNAAAPFNFTALVTGLAVGTDYWFDMQVGVGAGTGIISGVTSTIIEL